MEPTKKVTSVLKAYDLDHRNPGGRTSIKNLLKLKESVTENCQTLEKPWKNTRDLRGKLRRLLVKPEKKP